jgi:hypothetical protein
MPVSVASRRGIKAWHQGGFGFARGANTTGVCTIAMLFVIWDVETLLRFAYAVSYRLGGWYEAEGEVFLAIPIVGYIRVYAGVGLKHVPYYHKK